MKKSQPRKTSKPLAPHIEAVIENEPPVPMVHCVICASDTQTGSPEGMCWVCRRLKISAWREVEQQIPVQE